MKTMDELRELEPLISEGIERTREVKRLQEAYFAATQRRTDTYLKLREADLTYREIGAFVGLGTTRVCEVVQSGLRQQRRSSAAAARTSPSH